MIEIDALINSLKKLTDQSKINDNQVIKKKRNLFCLINIYLIDNSVSSSRTAGTI
jgi:hypothetical protein